MGGKKEIVQEERRLRRVDRLLNIFTRRKPLEEAPNQLGSLDDDSSTDIMGSASERNDGGEQRFYRRLRRTVGMRGGQ